MRAVSSACEMRGSGRAPYSSDHLPLVCRESLPGPNRFRANPSGAACQLIVADVVCDLDQKTYRSIGNVQLPAGRKVDPQATIRSARLDRRDFKVGQRRCRDAGLRVHRLWGLLRPADRKARLMTPTIRGAATATAPAAANNNLLPMLYLPPWHDSVHNRFPPSVSRSELGYSRIRKAKATSGRICRR